MQDTENHNEEQTLSAPTPESTIYLTCANHVGEVDPALEGQFTIHLDDMEHQDMDKSKSEAQDQSTTTGASMHISPNSPKLKASDIMTRHSKNRQQAWLAQVVRYKEEEYKRIHRIGATIVVLIRDLAEDHQFDIKVIKSCMEIMEQLMRLVSAPDWKQVMELLVKLYAAADEDGSEVVRD